MDQGESSSEMLFKAQSHLYAHVFSFISSMSLKCAVELGIPDAVGAHGQPITLQELAFALGIRPNKTPFLGRLMRLLAHLGLFRESPRGSYQLTPSSTLLLKDRAPCLSPFITSILDPALMAPWPMLGGWLREEEEEGCGTPFESAHGVRFWEYLGRNSEFGDGFKEAMASDSGMVNLVVGECGAVFEGINSLVDVGGGTGAVARIVAEAFPRMKCTVLDLPHVVAGLTDSDRLTFVGGDMFEFIPSADAVLLKLMLHAFSDDDCLRVLRRCRESISKPGGKVIIIDIVIDKEKDDEDLTQGKLYFDLLMMVVVRGKERQEKDWRNLFHQAGFSRYKITPLFGLKSLIEVFP